ncbi:hypothetical protein SAMN05216266_10157 [Amycolatopsis marina]|uniref:2TM domain-containing protein n=1 Tax=Amycolatopsis marina TaxID=490629 RepID=A0A1I0V7H5_9PSEU|nr:hypothetical protein [Amycolatopsis marina]SFA72309.1 hypothetical protein SAMN05216266_10157 [Amycolatopsis marina]
MNRVTAGTNGRQLWHYLPRLPRPVFFYAGVHFSCMAVWLVLWLLNSRDTLHLALAGVFAALGLAHVAVECVHARRRDAPIIGLDKSRDAL